MVRVHFITQGCSANVADSETMQGLVKEHGDELVNSVEEADVVVFNTCTVKGPTESFFKKKLKELKAKNKKVVIAGCIPQGQVKDFQDYSRIGTYQIKRINEVVSATEQGNVISRLERVDEGRLNIPKVRKNPLIEIVPILQGCLNTCTFCKTKHARGNAQSYPVQDIVRHISKAVEEGAKEIWLTSQDNAVYGLEFNSNLAKLLKEIVSIDRDFKMRVGMGNPKYMLPYLDELIEVMKNKKIFKFIHIPLQAGNDQVLEDMKRGYTVDEYKMIISRIKEVIPEMSIATDIICGYPTETEEAFQDTLRAIRETKPDAVNISRFWPRPGTPAARLKEIPGDEMKSRTKRVMQAFSEVALENNKRWIGKEETIIITEKGKNNTSIAKNKSYKQVVIKGDYDIGTELNVRFTDCGPLDLKAELT